ncbi:MAG: SAM-dependent DNA methyltransferase, partial [Chloroflexi bacterium]|nr:SAM-dependent DNA methyltransferase [Chloroflexota bacterium]
MPVDERTFVSEVAAWVTAILERRPDLPYSRARVEEHGVGSHKRHDFLLYRRGLNKVVLTGEVKMPDSPGGKSPFDGELVDDAFQKASRRGVPYYFTWNIRDFMLWETHREGVPVTERRVEGPTRVADASISDDVHRPEVEEDIHKFWEKFLESFAALEEGRRPLQNLPLDRRFILRIEAALEDPIFLTEHQITHKYRQDSNFRSRLNTWMVVEQGWDVSEAREARRQNLERASRLSCYVLLTRLVFYEVLRRRFPRLAPLASAHLDTPPQLVDFLTARFSEAITYSKDYETVFQPTGFGSELPLLHPDSHKAWASVIERIGDFDFSSLDFEIIGRLYEQLISPSERRQYGQFYTSPDVVDFINAFCIRSSDARVLDPACGGGTFLVRAYARKRALALRTGLSVTHQELLSHLFGVDIAEYPA